MPHTPSQKKLTMMMRGSPSLVLVMTTLWLLCLSTTTTTALSPLFQSASSSSRTGSILHRLKHPYSKVEDLPVPPSKQIGYGEESRKYRRTIYTHHDWEKHRSEDRFIRNLRTAMASGIYKNIRKYVVTVTALATAICIWNRCANSIRCFGILPAWLRNTVLQLPMAPFSLAMPSLGLLLVFRTNTAYARWDEARKNWGLNINHTRDLTRMATAMYDAAVREQQEQQQRETSSGSRSSTTTDDATALLSTTTSSHAHLRRTLSGTRRHAELQRVALGAWAFARAMKRHLSPDHIDEIKFRQEVQERLPAAQATALIAATHRPNRALQDLSTVIEGLPLHFLRRDKLHATLTRFEDNLGSSERLLSSPVPLFYTRHTTRFLAVWLLLLPFALYQAFGGHLATIPATAILSTCLFGIDELATQLEEPFTILPMQSFCDKIYDGCTEIVNFAPLAVDEEQQHQASHRKTTAVPTMSRSSTSSSSTHHGGRRDSEFDLRPHSPPPSLQRKNTNNNGSTFPPMSP